MLKPEVENLISHLMEKFGQNRTVIEYGDETVMLEYSGEIDPGIKRKI